MQWTQTAPALLRQAAVVDLRAGDAVIVLDAAGTCIGVDDRVEPILGLDAEQLLGLARVDARWHWCGADGRPVRDTESPVAVAMASGEPVLDRVLGLEGLDGEPDGRFAWVEVSAYPLRGADGSVAGVATSLRDVSLTAEGRAATAGLVRSLRTLVSASAEDEARFLALAENSADVLFQTDIVGRCVWVSPSVSQVLGWEPEAVRGQSLVRLLHPDDREIANERRLASLAHGGGGHERLELRYATAGGGWRWMSVLSRPMRDASGRAVGAVSALHDIQAEVERREEQHYRAGRDALTGLLTREAGLRALAKALVRVRGTGRLVGVLVLDVDALARINQVHGTPGGDAALVHVAERLTSLLRDTDSVARLGPDEFLVVLTSVAVSEHAVGRAGSLLEGIAVPRGPEQPTVSVSVGVATDDGTGAAPDVLRRAGAGLVTAKRAGGGRVGS